jgi:hypothetical protein
MSLAVGQVLPATSLLGCTAIKGVRLSADSKGYDINGLYRVIAIYRSTVAAATL